MLYYSNESPRISAEQIREALHSVLDQLGRKKRVIAIPPDITRLNSFAGPITAMLDEYYGSALTDIMPALGTHSPMTEEQIKAMFPGISLDKFRVHDWRNDIVSLGTVPADYVREISEGRVDFSMEAQVNKLLIDSDIEQIFSIGQVVPHEVIGMANHAKNIFVGVGGSDFINKSHFIGAAYGMERIMGRASNPVRSVFEYARTQFAAQLPIIYILTVRAKDPESGELLTRGLFIGDDFECFDRAAALSKRLNFDLLPKPIRKCLVWLDPEEFKSTWLGNKAIYRTRMALADDAELLIAAPALREFGEDPTIDALIRRYGYKGTAATLTAISNDNSVNSHPSTTRLRDNLGAAAHLIHGSSEQRFRITYCPGDGVSREEIESVGYNYMSLRDLLQLYNIPEATLTSDLSPSLRGAEGDAAISELQQSPVIASINPFRHCERSAAIYNRNTNTEEDCHTSLRCVRNDALEESHSVIASEARQSQYQPPLKDGWNTLPNGEEIYYISNPALGLWAYKDRFNDE